MMPAWGAAEQLVPGKEHEVAALTYAFGHGRFRRQTADGKIHQAA